MTSNWEIISVLVALPHITWTFAFCARAFLRVSGRKGPAIASRLFFEIRPFVPALIAGRYICDSMTAGLDHIGWRLVFLTLDVAVYLVARREKDDDDRWKRRAEAVADGVRDLGHRLVIVPGGAR